MSSTFVADTADDRKSDNTLIIIVNNDGTISVDPDTLQNIIANPEDAPVSVIRVGASSQGDENSQDSNGTCDSQGDGNPHVSLTVEGFYSPAEPPPEPPAEPQPPTADPPLATPSETPLDPFLEMDPEQLQRLETALQSEQAKQILGENVTAMLDMLSVDEDASKLKETIRMDHCYTSLSPSSAPSTTPSENTTSAGSEVEPAVNNVILESQKTTSFGRGAARGTRGRGRGPGRPRKELSSTRSSLSYRGASSVRGLGRGTVTGTDTSNNLVMVQQIKHITAPPPNSPSASLVPLIKPLILPSDKNSSVNVGQGLTFTHKQATTAPSGGSQLVSLASKAGGLLTSGGQQRVIVTNNTAVPLHELSLPPVVHTPDRTIVQNSDVNDSVVTSNSMVVVSRSPSTQVTPTSLSASTGEAKVLVAKMPSIPPQLLGAQPTSTSSESQKIPLKTSSEDDDDEFANFPRGDDTEESEEDDDPDTDDDYRARLTIRQRGYSRGGRGSRGRGIRSRGSSGRGWDRSRGARGGARRRGGTRGGRGAAAAKSEDVEQVHKLDSEMAAALAAMDKAQNSCESVAVPSEDEHNFGSNKSVMRNNLNNSNADSVLESSLKRKPIRSYGRSQGKRKSDMDSEGILSKSIEPPVEKLKEEDDKPVSAQLQLDTKSVTKNAVVKQTSVADSPVSPVSPVPPVKISVVTDHKTDIRKNYPKRENRKPPAHLAEALGPALFSTPDIIRRVNAGSEHKSFPTTDLKKEETRAAPKKSADHSIQDLVSSPLEEKGEMAEISISGGEEKNEANSQPTITVQQEVTDSVIPAQNQKTEVDTEVSHHDTNLEVDVPAKGALVSTADTELQKELNENSVSEKSETKVERTMSTRPIRKRNIHIYADLIMDRDMEKALKNSTQAQVKDKRKSDDSGTSQGRNKGRRRHSSEVRSVDDFLPSSDEESWNSEDDPDRLWCICKKPHNNRFMICCDICEDWFHGKCVGITKAMGQQMENKGLEWSCPNCSKKNEAAEKSKDKDPKRKSGKDKDTRRESLTENQTIIKEDSSLLSPATSSDQRKDAKEIKNEEKISAQNNLPALSNEDTKPNVETESTLLSDADTVSVTSCIVCKKEARQSSIYCSHACILKHAEESQQNVATAASVTKANQSGGINKHTMEQSPHHIPKPQTRVIVYERRTGKLLSGKNAPTLGNLKNWLKDNPTFEVMKPNEVTSSRVAGKLTFQHTRNTTTHSPQQNSQETQQKVTPSQPKPSPQQKSILSYYQPAEQAVNTEASQQKQGVQNKQPVVQSKPAQQPQKVTIKSNNIPDQPKGQHVVLASVKPPKVQKQTILISPEQVNKLSIKTVTKPTVSSAKSEPKSPVSPSPSNKGHIQNIKPSPINVVSKVSVVSSVKETDKTSVKKVENKRISSDSTKKEEDKEKEKDKEKDKDKEKNPGPEPIRLNVRKTLKELLQSRIQECSDLHVTEEEIQDIALNIEEEMHSYFRDTGIKYKSKYRSLVFNIKDPKNLTLFRKIAEKSVTPHQLVRLSPEELANQELAQWREREAKHQIEMIKKNELDLLSLTKTYVMKTHKGEQVIEADEVIKAEVPELVDPSTVPDVPSLSGSVITSTLGEKKPEVKDEEKVKDKVKDTKDKDKIKREDKDRNIENEKSKHEKKSSKDKSEKHKKDERESSKRDHHHHHHHGCSRSDREKRHESRDHKEKHKRSEKGKHEFEKNKDHYSTDVKKEKKTDENTKEEKLHKKNNPSEVDSDDIIKHKHSDHDSKTRKGVAEAEEYRSSSDFVKVESQDTDETIDQESLPADQEKIPDVVCIPSLEFGVTIWQGFVNMPDVSRFYATVQLSSGDVTTSELPSAIEIVGRIMPDTVWDYISKMKKTGTKEIIVLRFTAANDAERIPYMTLYSYLNARNRMGVVGSVSRTIKDFYIMPLSGHTPLPQILLPIDGTGFEDIRPHLLLGILVRTKRKRLAPENEYIAKAPRHSGVVRTVERSYTPPLPGTGPDGGGSLTPPHPPPSVSDSYTPPISPTQSLYSGSQHQLSLQSRWSDDRDSDKDSTDDQVRGFKKSSQPYTADDDDAPYSPGESDDYQEDSGEDNMQSPLNTQSELERKMEELNRKIEEQKQQIQTISSAIVSSEPAVAACGPKQYQVMKNYVVVGDEKVSSITSGDDENEAYSPSRSFTPPPSIPFIGPSETQSMLPSLPSNISIPSNLHEILASIKKRESDLPIASGSRGMDLKTDPIVQNYANNGQDVEIPGLNDDTSNSPHSYSANKQFQSPTEPPLGQSAKSVVPALLSLSTPVVHPHNTAAQTIETRSHRDPRQRSSVPCDTSVKSSGSTLSKLSDDDLIKKAAEMMEMERKDSLDVDKRNVYPKSIPASVESLHSSSGSVGKVIPTQQPLPPGVEDEDYGSYGTPFVPSASGSTALNIPMPPTAPPSTSYQAPPPPPPPPPAPVPYTSTRRYSQPPPAYNLPRSKEASYTSSFSSSYSDVKTEIKVTEPGSSRKKRKFHEDVVRSDVKRSRSSPMPSSRDTWDSKAPVPLRGRFNMRGRGYVRGNRGFMRKGRGMGPNRGRWGGPPPSEKHFSRRSPRYDASIRSEWDMHIKDFEQKHRERSREMKHRERERIHDRTTVTQRSSRSSSRRNRDNEHSDSS